MRICIRRISAVLVEEVNSNKTGNISIYPSLILFLCKLFAISSTKLNNIIEELYNLEQNFPNSKLIEVYFIILYKGEKMFPITEIFRDHLKEYIKNNSGKGALSVWYRMVLINQSQKIVFLDENLNKKDYFVKSEDFVGYPLKRNENILLFKYLYKDRERFFENQFIIESDYYQNSIKAITREELFKLSFDQIMKIYNNIYEFVDLFKLFIKIKEFDEQKYRINFTILVDELASYKSQFDSLCDLLSFFDECYPKSRKDDIKSLKIVKNKLMMLPLNQFNDNIKVINNFDEYKDQVDIYKKLKNSIFFIEIYNASKKMINSEQEQDQEKKIFDNSIEQFNQLKKLADDSNLNILDKELINILISAAKKNRNKLINELYFVKKYFDINKNSDKFDVEKIALEVEKLIPDNVKSIEVSVPKEENENIVGENQYIKIVVGKFNDCYNFYKNNKKKQIEDNYLEKLINYFKEIFEDEKIKEFNSEEFTDNITKKMLILFYSQIIDFRIPKNNALKNGLQLIKDFFEILNIYKSINNDNLYSISENLKSIFPSLKERMSETKNDIFKGLSEDLFPSIVEKDESKKQAFSPCFINIINDEIKNGRIKNDPKEVLSFIFKNEYLNKNCISVIDNSDYKFKDRFFSNLINKNINDNSILYFNDSDLSPIDTNCKNNKILSEQLLYYFETNIKKIFEEKYRQNEFIQSEKIKIFFKKIRAYFKEKPKVKSLNENINLLFFIGFLKVFYTKYIYETEKEINLRDHFYDNFLIEENFSLTKSLSYFILKLYLDIEGNFSDFFILNKISIPKEILDKNNNNVDKNFGFDYLILTIKKKKAVKFNQIYRQIINCINVAKNFDNDIGIIDDINDADKNDLDTLYCIISNIFLSKLSIENYEKNDEYT